MEQLTPTVEIETGLRGANHGLVTTSEGLVMIDTPYKPSDALRMRDVLATRAPLRYIINTEPHLDHWTGNAYFDAPVIAHEGVRARILATDPAEHRARVIGLGPDEEQHLVGYRPTPPTITFTAGMTLHLGDHTLRLIHMPGHTPYQAAVLVVEEGVIFTSDNVFAGVQPWLQEGDPVVWLETLDALRALPADILVPGHGHPCGKEYLDELEAYIREWVEYVREAIDRGWSRERCVNELTAMTDRYPMDVGQAAMAPRVMQMNAGNLYDYLTGSGIHQRPGAEAPRA
jgi:cyclase